jgi:DNA invertase Pin-like site-specific DNA recombinase
MKVALYARVSTADKNQNPDNQLRELKAYCERAGYEIAHIYIDKASAKDYRRRVAWESLKAAARRREFNAVIVWRLDRAFRSVRECENTINDWYERGVKFLSVTQDVIDTTTSSGRFMLSVIAAVAELESGFISDRVKAGMARVKSEGRTFGRPRLKVSVARIKQAVKDYGSNGAAARALGISRGSVSTTMRGIRK